MSEGGAFFKVKSSKRSNPETRTTLDAIHNQKIQKMIEEKENVEAYKQQLNELQLQLDNTTSDTELWQIERKMENIKKSIKKIEDDSNIMDYYLRSGDILFNYYDIQDKIQMGVKSNISVKAKPGSILAILEEISQSNDDNKYNSRDTEEEKQGQHGQQNKQDKQEKDTENIIIPISENKNNNKLQRSHLLNEYLQIEEPDMVRNTFEDFDDPWTKCDNCSHEMIICMNEANLTCSNCGHQEFIIIDSDKPSYKDPPREVCYYAYKKINHFNEWLAQFQAKESTEIPNDIYDMILVQLKKERITDMTTLKPTKLREILRKLKCSKYYEHIPHIINRLNGQNAPFMSREDEEKLRHMFKEIQPSFKKHCPKSRRNFLSYGYVLYKLCELLEMDEFLASFPLLKNRDKLYLQDKLWQKICEDMQWQYIRTL